MFILFLVSSSYEVSVSSGVHSPAMAKCQNRLNLAESDSLWLSQVSNIFGPSLLFQASSVSHLS